MFKRSHCKLLRSVSVRTDETKLKTDNKNNVLSRSSIKLKIAICHGRKLTAAIFDNEILYKKVELEALASCDLALEFKTDSLAKENVYVSAS